MVRPVTDFLADLRDAEAAGEVSAPLARTVREHVARTVTAEAANLPGPRGDLSASVLSFPDQVQNYAERAGLGAGAAAAEAPGAAVTVVVLVLARSVLVLGGFAAVILVVGGWNDGYDPDGDRVVAGLQTALATAFSSAVLFGLHAALVLLRRIDAAVRPADRPADRESGHRG